MPKITFYRQLRADGGVRTGIEAGGIDIYHYENESEEPDPSLVWYVDLRLEGDDLPTDPEAAAQWLLGRKAAVYDAFVQFADKLRAGVDNDGWPVLWEPASPVPGTRTTLACSCVRLIDAQGMAGTVAEIATHWGQYLQQVLCSQAHAR